VLLVDGGDVFGNASSVSTLDDMLRAEYLLKGMQLLGYDVITLGEEDFRFGETFLASQLAQSQVPTTSANLYRVDDSQPYTTRFYAVALPGLTMGVIGVLGEEHQDEVQQSSSIDGVEVKARSAVDELQSAMAVMGPTDLVVVLAHMTETAARDLLAQVSGIDIAIVTHERFPPLPVQQVGDSLLFTTGYDGKWINYLSFDFSQGQMSNQQADQISLDASWDDDPQLAQLYQQYLARLEDEAENILAQIPQQVPTGGQYVGDEQCRGCHLTQASQWDGTEHAGAFTTLVNTNHDYSPSCFGCHTTGFGFKGGFTLPNYTPGLKNVQCESCHGAGAEHAAAPAAGQLPEPTPSCTVCHTAEHSPEFELSTYLPLVQH